MINTTHAKRRLTAICQQWRGDNLDELQAWGNHFGVSFELVNRGENDSLWLIGRGCITFGLPPNYWVVRQENGEIRTYSPERFNLIYEGV